MLDDCFSGIIHKIVLELYVFALPVNLFLCAIETFL